MSPPTCDHVVMIVEDDPDVRESIADVLEDCSYRSLAAANGREALDRLRASSHKPCVILLDIMMPVMDGWQFRQIQRDDPELGHIPVVVLTAHADIRRVAEHLAAAASLAKPVQLDVLLDTVSRFCGQDPSHPRARPD